MKAYFGPNQGMLYSTILAFFRLGGRLTEQEGKERKSDQQNFRLARLFSFPRISRVWIRCRKKWASSSPSPKFSSPTLGLPNHLEIWFRKIKTNERGREEEGITFLPLSPQPSTVISFLRKKEKEEERRISFWVWIGGTPSSCRVKIWWFEKWA